MWQRQHYHNGHIWSSVDFHPHYLAQHDVLIDNVRAMFSYDWKSLSTAHICTQSLDFWLSTKTTTQTQEVIRFFLDCLFFLIKKRQSEITNIPIAYLLSLPEFHEQSELIDFIFDRLMIVGFISVFHDDVIFGENRSSRTFLAECITMRVNMHSSSVSSVYGILEMKKKRRQ